MEKINIYFCFINKKDEFFKINTSTDKTIVSILKEIPTLTNISLLDYIFLLNGDILKITKPISNYNINKDTYIVVYNKKNDYSLVKKTILNNIINNLSNLSNVDIFNNILDTIPSVENPYNQESVVNIDYSEIYKNELEQLNDMGFYNVQQNIEALRINQNIEDAVIYLIGYT